MKKLLFWILIIVACGFIWVGVLNLLVGFTFAQEPCNRIFAWDRGNMVDNATSDNELTVIEKSKNLFICRWCHFWEGKRTTVKGIAHNKFTFNCTGYSDTCLAWYYRIYTFDNGTVLKLGPSNIVEFEINP